MGAGAAWPRGAARTSAARQQQSEQSHTHDGERDHERLALVLRGRRQAASAVITRLVWHELVAQGDEQTRQIFREGLVLVWRGLEGEAKSRAPAATSARA
jgi:hypothetical protein